ncbi:phosphoribosylanthranilate isomerase [Nocardia sp. 852002-20019_SCH5090214]|uniref:N-(5'-phosphoribosyl)anthranilate isomerase n=1 Tax=Nocardia nova TaxID=37330 RepID=A0A2S5ZW62_9NOCA|nr:MULTISPECIES: phosphoribosylanthranilate isomerase [Nocardia]OBA63540.1 phosphoribosylanthranilate isomerase [Nocardia sp. 852002-20019_SCH5090214]PPJ05123.1 phosphoribosylanthranilate isomerase [Nocardia nova]PPJ21795.1 phosphoribosylanthranilate isomerase [Nocardia nova]
MITVRTKICGIRSESDLRAVVAADADAAGFISGTTHFSEDELDPESAHRLSRLVPSSMERVLVTHLTDAGEVLRLADRIGVDCIQLHGLISHDTARAVRRGAGGRRVIRAVHVTGPEAVAAAERAAPDCDGLVLDSRSTDRLGGTGRTHDWSISARIVELLDDSAFPVMLAGGLDPHNVTAAIDAVRPAWVDVNSGVDDGRGDKDPATCTEFVRAARDVAVPIAALARPRSE